MTNRISKKLQIGKSACVNAANEKSAFEYAHIEKAAFVNAPIENQHFDNAHIENIDIWTCSDWQNEHLKMLIWAKSTFENAHIDNMNIWTCSDWQKSTFAQGGKATTIDPGTIGRWRGQSTSEHLNNAQIDKTTTIE